MIFRNIRNGLQFHFWSIFCGQKVNFKWLSYQADRPLVDVSSVFWLFFQANLILINHPHPFLYFGIELPRKDINAKRWICLNRSKGPFSSSERSDLAPFHIFIYVIQ